MTLFSSYGAEGVPKFDDTLGAVLIGGLLAMGLWGVTCVQTFAFFTRESNDTKLFRYMIAFLWALDTFDSALNGHILYYYLVTNYLNPAAIGAAVWSVVIHVVVTSISNFFIRTTFAQRFYQLSRGNFLTTAWIMAISAADLVVGAVITAKAMKLKTYVELNKIRTLYYVAFATGTVSDFSVALSLCYLLLRSRTGFRNTDSLINTLMMYTVNTGLIVAVDATISMITYALMPQNFIWLGFYLLLSKLYLNCYLATLNARKDLRRKLDQPVSIHLSQIMRSGTRFDIETSPSTVGGKENSPEGGSTVIVRPSIEKPMDSRSAPSGSR